MKISFTYNKNKYMICTIKEFANILGKIAAGEEISKETKFIADFFPITIGESINFNKIGKMAEEAINTRYGVKELGEIGFNDTAKNLIFNRYNGHQMVANTFISECTEGDCTADILDSLCLTLDVGKRDADLHVLVQWTKDEYLVKDDQEAARTIQQYEVVEVCPECGAENIMTWDVEKDGYVAYCPHCGSKMMLCDECLHADDAKVCDWCARRGCYRERQNKEN